MSFTPAQLVDALARSGRRVTLRRLKDWRDLGLVPQLVQHGLGRGVGSEQVWVQDDIINRVTLVYDLLAIDTQTRTATISLWLLGFDIPLDSVRTAWIEQLSKIETSIASHVTRYGSTEDGIAKLTAPLARPISDRLAISRDDIRAIAAEIGEIVHGETSPEDTSYLEDLIASAVSQKHSGNSPNTEGAKDFFGILYHVIAPQYNIELVGRATDEHMLIAQEIWGKIHELVSILSGGFDKICPREQPSPEVGFRVAYGRFAVPMLLYLQSKGYVAQLQKTGEMLDEFLQSCAATSSLGGPQPNTAGSRGDPSAIIQALSRLHATWSQTEFGPLLPSLR